MFNLTQISLPRECLAVGKGVAAEEAIFGREEECDHCSEDGPALAGPAPSCCLCHPAGGEEVPSAQTPAEGSAGRHQGSGTTVVVE